MSTLIVYFSHNKENYVNGKIKVLDVGNTKVVAQKIQNMVGGDMFEILPLHEYPYDYYECTHIAKEELQSQARPKIKNMIPHIEDYDTIYLGYPSWWGTMPMCVWTFLESYDLSHKHIYPFCTHEGSGLGKSVVDIKQLCPNSLLHQGIAIQGAFVGGSDQSIEEWVKESR